MRVLLLDGSNMLHRNFHAFPYLTSKDGKATGAIYGTIKMLKSLNERFNPDVEIFFTDYSRKSFRSLLLPEYKGNRSETAPELKEQFSTMENLCSCSRLECIKKENYEADDLIGTYANLYSNIGAEVYIVSGDKDLFQLISSNIKLVYSSTKDGFVEYDEAKCKEKFGLFPKQIIDLKAICGDTADNYKGIPGVGEKTATKLLAEYNNLDGIYENIESLKGKIKDKFSENKDVAYLCKQLATIDCSIPDLTLPNYSLFTLTEESLNFLKRLDIKHI